MQNSATQHLVVLIQNETEDATVEHFWHLEGPNHGCFRGLALAASSWSGVMRMAENNAEDRPQELFDVAPDFSHNVRVIRFPISTKAPFWDFSFIFVLHKI